MLKSISPNFHKENKYEHDDDDDWLSITSQTQCTHRYAWLWAGSHLVWMDKMIWYTTDHKCSSCCSRCCESPALLSTAWFSRSPLLKMLSVNKHSKKLTSTYILHCWYLMFHSVNVTMLHFFTHILYFRYAQMKANMQHSSSMAMWSVNHRQPRPYSTSLWCSWKHTRYSLAKRIWITMGKTSIVLNIRWA